MGSTDVSVGKRSCDVHRDRPAVDRCGSCGRTVCVKCAVPVRGQVLCSACAARAVGEPPPAVPERRPTRVPETTAAILLGVALVATIPPWDRFGTSLSAWRPAVSSWRVFGVVALVVALAAACLSAWRGPRRPTFAADAAYTVLAAAGAITIAWQLVGSPDYVVHTAVPYAVVALAAAAAAVGGFRMLRLR